LSNPVFDTAREAAIAGLQIAIPLARKNRWEYGGYVLYAPNGKFTYGDIVTSQDQHGVSLETAAPKELKDLSDALDAKKGLTREERKEEIKRLNEKSREYIIGAFHVHITDGKDEDGDDVGPSSLYFSGTDIVSAARAKWIAWLGHTATGKVFELDGRTQESMLATSGERKLVSDFFGGDESTNAIMALASLIGRGPPPILAQGIEVYAGDYQQEQKEAA
jgi:hypothetical protein